MHTTPELWLVIFVVAVFALTIIGGLIGCWWFSHHPSNDLDLWNETGFGRLTDL
jgi:hypothetical protein